MRLYRSRGRTAFTGTANSSLNTSIAKFKRALREYENITLRLFMRYKNFNKVPHENQMKSIHAMERLRNTALAIHK